MSRSKMAVLYVDYYEFDPVTPPLTAWLQRFLWVWLFYRWHLQTSSCHIWWTIRYVYLWKTSVGKGFGEWHGRSPAIHMSYIGSNREYLAPQIRSMNNWFHSEGKLPWSYDYPLANQIILRQINALPIVRCPCSCTFTLLSGIFWKFSRQGV